VCAPVQAGPHIVEVQYQKVKASNYVNFTGSALACVIGARELLVDERIR
jgi:hypothetical protein